MRKKPREAAAKAAVRSFTLGHATVIFLARRAIERLRDFSPVR
jgi:hypothetical protein